jgi:hypothetical protein
MGEPAGPHLPEGSIPRVSCGVSAGGHLARPGVTHPESSPAPLRKALPATATVSARPAALRRAVFRRTPSPGPPRLRLLIQAPAPPGSRAPSGQGPEPSPANPPGLFRIRAPPASLLWGPLRSRLQAPPSQTTSRLLRIRPEAPSGKPSRSPPNQAPTPNQSSFRAISLPRIRAGRRLSA